MEDYYVYVYLDPRKPGEYKFSGFEFQFEPFYIGKGRSHRYRNHLLKVKSGNYKNLPKYHVIKKILDTGIDPIIIKYKTCLIESDAFLLEKDMILKIGRKDLNNGPLRNLSNGGEGNGERKFTDEHIKNLSTSRKGNTSEKQIDHLKSLHKKMIGNKRTLGMKFSEDTKTKMSNSSKKKSVLQMDKSGEILMEFKSIKDANSHIGFNISRVLRGEGKSAGGFFWKYKDEEENIKIEIKNSLVKKNKKQTTGKKVVMMDIKMNILNEYDTITDASKDTGVSVGNISKNLTGKGKSAGGFFWRYKK